MLTNETFRNQAHQVVDWIADYLENIQQYPVKPSIAPGALRAALPDEAPQSGEAMDDIWKDFLNMIVPGITHWQHPGFMALFPSNASYPGILGEIAVSGLGINAMMWDTSPSATELEQTVMEWLRKATGLPDGMLGVIHDTASMSTLTAIISARERYAQFQVNQHGFHGYDKLVMYCTDQTHYSIEKGAKAAGIGAAQVKKIATDDAHAMIATALTKQIAEDKAAGLQPFMVVATLGTTSTLAFDPLEEIGNICVEHKLWLHVDAAYAGSAFFLNEYRHFLQGIDHADSYVFNAHKWLFTNFDCSCYFVKDANHLINTFSANPDYLKRTEESVAMFKDWGIPLGRRFRALKLWFVLRNYGMSGIQELLRKHIDIATNFRNQLLSDTQWELMAPPVMNMFCVRYHPQGINDNEALNALNTALLKSINADGNYYLSGTIVKGMYMIRVVMGQTHLEQVHAEGLLALMRSSANSINDFKALR